MFLMIIILSFRLNTIFFFVDIDMTHAIGCNQESSQCIRDKKDNSTIQEFQKMFCP